MRLTLSIQALLALSALLAVVCTGQPAMSQEPPLLYPHAGDHSVPPSQAHLIKYDGHLSLPALQHRPDTDLVELSNGRRIKLGELRRLDTFSKKLRATPDRHVIPGLRQQPATIARVNIKSAADLTAALKLQDTETIQLPSGKRYTVAQLRLAQEMAIRNLGIQPQQRVMQHGALIHVSARTDWKAVLSGPDTTILQSPNGTKITVAELKKTLAAWKPVSNRTKLPNIDGRQP